MLLDCLCLGGNPFSSSSSREVVQDRTHGPLQHQQEVSPLSPVSPDGPAADPAGEPSSDSEEEQVKRELESGQMGSDCTELIAAYPNSPTAWLARANFLSVSAAKTSVSAAAFKRALSLSNNKNADAWTGLGHVYANISDFASASVCFRQASNLAPRSVQAHLTLGLSLIAMGNARDALQAYFAALRLRPADKELEGELHFNVALVYEDIKSTKLAATSYKAVISALSPPTSAKGRKLLLDAQLNLASLQADSASLKSLREALTTYMSIELEECDRDLTASVLKSIEFLRRELECSEGE